MITKALNKAFPVIQFDSINSRTFKKSMDFTLNLLCLNASKTEFILIGLREQLK